RALHRPRTDQPPRVGQEDNLEQQGGRVGWRTSLVVAIPDLKGREIHLLINQITQRVLEGAGQNLPSEIHGQGVGTHINRLVTRHWVFLACGTSDQLNMPLPFLLGQGEGFSYSLNAHAHRERSYRDFSVSFQSATGPRCGGAIC